MSLALYKKKRLFAKTPEPPGRKAKTVPSLRFVVQQHAASHLHYDFRLEMDGVLKSWAIPKGPSMDPEIKRLAVMVEDHPYDYRNFEGIIPKGNYGAGSVIIWDEGVYESTEINGGDKKVQQKNLLYQLHKGKIRFVLHGEKLKGEFALIQSFGRGENSWLLIKMRDKYASSADITEKNKSVHSKKTLKEIANAGKNSYREKTINPLKKKDESTEEINEKKNQSNVEGMIVEGKKSVMLHGIKPMLATLTNQPFDNKEWIYEIKWDGYRAISYLNNGKADLRSRNNLSFNKQFHPVSAALKEWKVKAVVDGEIVAVNEKGTSDFQQLQGFHKNGKPAHLLYFVFDIIWYDGYSLGNLPLLERKEILRQIVPENNPVIKYNDHIVCNGKSFFKAALKNDLEGIMAKKADSKYAIGQRSSEWLKIKNNKRLEAIICGFTKGRNSRKYFGAVILGKYFGKELKYIGHSGSGFNDIGLKDVYEKFKPLITDRCPFKIVPKTNMPVTWLRPQMLCEVKFTEWTDMKSLRHPIFAGLREDKKAVSEKEEKIVNPPKETAGKNAAIKPVKKKIKYKKVKLKDAEPLLFADSKEEIIKVKGRQLKFTNLDKIYWPKEKITKRDMLNYYYRIMPFILPYMKDRPQSLNRHPNGINKPNFYQKNVDGKVADWIETYAYKSESDGKKKQFLVCPDEATLMYIANMGCIELNPWHSRIQFPDNPDWCVIDLDPDGNNFDQVIEAALVIKKVLDGAGIAAYCKTSGATGIHIYIPLGAKYNYEQSKLLAQLVVGIAHQQIPSFTSLERTPAKRKKKIYLDFLQNRSIQTIAAPYSLRPRPGATISTPLHWEELKTGLTPQDFTIYNIHERLKRKGDIFENVLGKGINLEQALKKINEQIE